jgi:hypothetical protein
VTPAPASVCAPHQAASVGVCHRCGVFLCQACVTRVDANVFCATCAARPDVDYVEAYRLAHWGKREGWAWFFGVSGLSSALSVVAAVAAWVRQGPTLDTLYVAGISAFGAVVGVSWFLRQQWARGLAIAQFAVLGVVLLVSGGVAMVPALVMLTLIIASAFTNVRSQLFFKLDVPRERLRRDWAIYHDNQAARSAAALAVGGLLVPGLGLMAIGFGVYAYRKVDPQAHPPIGGRASSLVGIIVGAIDVALWVFIIFYAWRY